LGKVAGAEIDGAALITNAAYDFVAVAPNESVTLNATVNEPDAVGLPEITPVDTFNVTPAGKDPLDNAHVYPDVPPVTVNVDVYAIPT